MRLTIDQFAAKCCMERRALMVYIGRKKVDVEEGGIVDSNTEKNLNFYNKREAKGLITSVPALAPAGKKTSGKQVPRSETFIDPDEKQDEEEEDDILPLPEAERRKKHFEAIVQERTVTLKEIDIQKKTGESIPTIMVESLMSETLRLFAIGYRDLYEREIQKIAQLAGFTTKQIAELRNSGINNINLVYNKSLELSRKSISKIVLDNSQKKGVGEKS